MKVRTEIQRAVLDSNAVLSSVGVFSLLGATIQLYLKDGSYQPVREYKVENDRVRFFSTDREEWEEIPLALVDLAKTRSRNQGARGGRARESGQTLDAEEKAEREARREVERVPVEAGVYLIENDKLIAIKAAESKVATDKKRSVLKILSPLPLVPGKATVEVDGPHAITGTANREPEFYIRLSE